MRSSLGLLTLVLFAHAAPPPASQDVAGGPTERESRAARETAAAFLSRITETRDIASLKQMYADDFVRRRLEIEQSAQTGFGSSASYRSLEAEVNPREWERLYAARVNLRYLMALYFIAGSRKFLTHEPTLSELCPPEVAALLDANPFLAEKPPGRKYKIETAEELRDVIAALEQAAALMRGHFAQSPPEGGDIYRENVRAWAAKRPQEEVYVQTGEWPGFPAGTRFFRLRTTPEFFDLTLVKAGDGMKIVWATVYLYD